jgi:hypothetical protein
MMPLRNEMIDYIMEYGKYMKDKNIQIQILNTAMRYVEDYCDGDKTNHIKAGMGSPSGLNFFLENFDDSTIQQIYNIIFRKMEILNSKYEPKVLPTINFNFDPNA